MSASLTLLYFSNALSRADQAYQDRNHQLETDIDQFTVSLPVAFTEVSSSSSEVSS